MEIYFFLCLLISTSSAWRIFHRGRAKGGNLGTPVSNRQDLPKDQWFDQRLDHFDPSNPTVWKQRYFVNNSFYTPDGPIFLMIGGEGRASAKWLVEGAWLRYAQKYNAHCIQLEHRYYGDSHPTDDLSVKNLAFLNSEQALADIANFIVSYKEQHNIQSNTKWITFGGSYPGSLSAWMRMKYPHLVQGAVSASGPLLAVADFKEYYAVVEESLKSYSEECVNVLQEAYRQFSVLMSHRVGQQSVVKLFQLCDPIDPTILVDIANLYESLASNFAGVVQYNKDNRDFEGAKGTEITIDFVCDTMLNKSLGAEVDRLATINSLLLSAYNQSCLDFKYDKMIKQMRESSWKSETAEGGRQWTYQTCTEFGFFQTSTLNVTQSLFGNKFPVDFFIKQCSDIFGKKFDKHLLEEGIARTNMMYGAFNIRADNVVYVHGSVDPWHALGITKTLYQGAPAIFIEGTAHCANMYPSSPKDPPQLSVARDHIEELIGTWLTQDTHLKRPSCC